jgi:hypothetical protein
VSHSQILERMARLGLHATELPTDRLSSATSALLCFPMYMVSNVHGWTDDRQFLVPILRAHGFEAAREAFAIGQVKAELEIDDAHEQVLASFLAAARPSDLLVYEYALETLRLFLEVAHPTLAEAVRDRVAATVVHVANAAGKQLFGRGDPVSPQERECIRQISRTLDLRRAAAAAAALDSIGAS